MLLSALTMRGLAQTTGKISGKVTTLTTDEPLVGANITLEGTSMGAATDINGEYFIINVPLGTYRLRVSMVGYERTVIQDLVVSVNRTTTADFKLKEGVIEEKEVVVTVERVQLKKDQTSSIRNITSDQMNALPVENLDQVVGLQAGVVRGHFRGGRDHEVAYLVNGVSVQEAYDQNRSVTVENDAIEEVEVITGTFNAEYGNAMSGVVNAVTKDGGSTLRGSASVLGGDYFTPHSYVFNNLALSSLSDLRRNGNEDYKLNLDGPIIGNALTFLVNGRYQNIVGPRNGIRRFMPDNYSEWNGDSTQWRSDHTGNNAIVPMETNQTANFFGKLSIKPWQMVRASIEYAYNYAKGDRGSSGRGTYDFNYKYNPDGQATDNGISQLLTATLNHALTPSIFYELKASYFKNWDAIYLFKNPQETVKNSRGTDSLNIAGSPVYRYVSDTYGSNSGPGFSTGGQDKTWDENWIEDYKIKLDATWQLNKSHTLKSGIDFTRHNLHRFNSFVTNGSTDNSFYDDSIAGKRVYLYYKPVLNTDVHSAETDIYVVQPWECSAYLQDKMEFDLMVINLGLRFDYFEPDIRYPSEPRNPDNGIINSPLSQYLNAPSSDQLSPRVGLSYKLGNEALLRFSYGHFFQMPPLYALYTDHSHIVSGDYNTLMGNPLVKAQKTIQYEAGFWQELGSNMSLEVAVYYRDIYDLLGTKTITLFNNTVHYGLYSNIDYGNARGLELKYDYFSGNWTAGINYTLQYTRGDANNPQFDFTQAGKRIDEVLVLVPMDFDQRHTLNASLEYNTEKYGGSIIGRFDSGQPYTWAPLATSPQANVNLEPNNSSKPVQVSFDLNGFVNLWSSGKTHIRLTLLVYNLFDRLNELNVNATTGRANDRIYQPSDLAGYRSNFSTIYDQTNDPSSFTNPRFVKMGIEFMF